MKKVLLSCSHINPRIDVTFGLRKLCNHALRHPGLRGEVSFDIASLHVDTPTDQAVDALLSGRPDLVGMSTFIWNLRDNVRLAEEIKRRSPHTYVVLGGPQVSDPLYDVLHETDAVDLVVRGEGEATFAELLESWVARGVPSPDVIAGVSYRRNAGATFHNPPRPLITELDELPQIYDGFRTAPRVLYGLETTRGCYMRCGYCTMGTIPFRKYSVDYVLEEIDHMAEAGVEVLNFLDSSFTFSRRRNEPIARRLRDHGIRFVCCAKAEEMGPEFGDLLIESGVIKIELGLQSMREETLRLMGRRMKLELFERNVRAFLDRATGTDIEVTVDVIAGLPGDDLESFRKAVDFAYDLRPHVVSSFPLQLLPATEFFRRADELGIERLPDDERMLRERGRYNLHRFGLVTQTATFPAAQVEAARRICLLNGVLVEGELTQTVHGILDVQGIRFTQFVDRLTALLPQRFFRDLEDISAEPGARRRVWAALRSGLQSYAATSSKGLEPLLRKRFPQAVTAYSKASECSLRPMVTSGSDSPGLAERPGARIAPESRSTT